jgi:hypothetical protein
MPAFEDIAAADYDERSKDLLDWLDTSTIIEAAGAPHGALAEHPAHTHTAHLYAPSEPSIMMQPRRDIVHMQDHDDLNNECSSRDIIAHGQYIMSLHHGLVSAIRESPDQARYIERLAAALLEFSIPEVWEDVEDIGKHNAEPLLNIMQNVRPVYDRSGICQTKITSSGWTLHPLFIHGGVVSYILW